MAQAGRKRKSGLREPNGRLQRATTVDGLNALADAARRKQQSVVLRQPHRRGEDSPLAENPLGRLCLRRRLRREMFEAGMNYAAIVACWRGAKGVPMATGRGTGKGSADGPSDLVVQRWQRQMLEIERAVTRHGLEALLVLRTLVLDEAEAGIERDEIAIVALKAAAVELGLMREHPEAFAS